MPELLGDHLLLAVSADGGDVCLHDLRRDVRWRVLASQRGWRPAEDAPLQPLPRGTAAREGDTLVAAHPVEGGSVRFRWTLATDHVRVELETSSDEVSCVTLPGPLVPEDGETEIAVPLWQGLLFRREPGTWQRRAMQGGHGQFSLGMVGSLSPRGGLLTAQEALSSWYGIYGAEEASLYAGFEQARCPAAGWHGTHAVRLIPTEPDVTSLARAYRQFTKERGEFVGWEDKLARKPILSKLFGALISFTGYNHAPGVDYAACVRRLKAYGFDSLLLFPVRMCATSLGFQMGGDAPVWLSDGEMARVKDVDGALVGPWGWVFEGLDDGSGERRGTFRRGPSGEAVPGWRIDDFQWYQVCTPYQAEHMRDRFAGDMAAMDWVHFDVNASVPPLTCHAAHPLHGGVPLGRDADTEEIRRLFSRETVGNRIVSSEGFVGRFAGRYDIGTTKVMPGPQMGDVTPVPLTMLVYHDSCVHDWWELQNYNEVPGFAAGEVGGGWGLAGSGRPALKAAMDALYGCPPNVFPFGRQYAWSDFAARRSVSFGLSLDDPTVQEALRCALPVARHHRQVGRLELTRFAFLNDARTLQATEFADGTRVVANLSPEPLSADGVGVLPAESWVAAL